MTLYVTTTRRKKTDGSYHVFYILRESFWDSETKGQKQRHVAYLGKEPIITVSKARLICRKIGITSEHLKHVKGLKIVK